MSTIHRRGVLLDGIGKELVRSANGGPRKTLSQWLANLQNSIELEDLAETFTSGDATPDVSGSAKWITAGSTAITDFDGATEGQVIHIYRGDADIVITRNASLIETLDAANITLTATHPMASFRSVSGVWREIERSNSVITATGSTTARTLAARFAEIRRAEDFGAAGDGSTDDAAAIQALLTAGYIWAPVSGKSYAIGARLNITSAGSGVIGDGTPLIIMLSGAGKFDNASSDSNDRYGADAVGIHASGIARPIIKGVRIKYETQTDDRYVKAIALRSCTDIRIENVEAWNFTKALGVIYIGACTGGAVVSNHVHDCTTNSATNGQITGIEFDNDDTASSQIDVDGNRIEDLTVGSSFLASYGYQTDGINVAKQTSNQLRFRGNHIKNCGEGFDHYGVDSEITDNHIEDCYFFGVKLIHGASRNTVAINTIRGIGLAGIALEGSSTATQDTADNLVFGNSIQDIDPNGDHSASETAGIRFGVNGGTTYLPRRNHVVENLIDCGANGKRGVLAGAGAGTVNFVLRNRIRNAQSSDYSMDATVVPYYQTEQAGNITISGTLDLGGVTTQTLGVSGGRFQIEGVNVPTISSTDTLTNKTLTAPQINDTSGDHQYVFVASELAADRNVTLPLLASDDTFVFAAHTQTLTNKTLTSPTLTTPRGVPYLLASSAVQQSVTGTTSDTTLATVTVPANAMGANGYVICRSVWSAAANNANAKTVRVKHDAQTFGATSLANNLSVCDERVLQNRNSASSQVAFQGGVPYEASTLAVYTGSVGTTAGRDITFTAQLGNSGDTVYLERYEVWVVYIA